MPPETSIEIAERFVSGSRVATRKLRGAVLLLLEFHEGFHGVAGAYIDFSKRNGGSVSGDDYANALHAEYIGQCA